MPVSYLSGLVRAEPSYHRMVITQRRVTVRNLYTEGARGRTIDLIQLRVAGRDVGEQSPSHL